MRQNRRHTDGQCICGFLVNGIVTVGKDLREATVAAILLEMACHQQLLTRGYGGWPTWSGADESLSKCNKIHPPAAVPAAWDYLVRQHRG